MSRKTLIILDFDGTIADTAAIVMEVGNTVLEQYGIPKLDEDRFEEMRGKTAPELLKEFHIPFYKIPSIVASVRHNLKSHMDDLEPIEGMLELIKDYSARENVELAVLSSNSLENVSFFLNKYEVRDCFAFLYGDVGVFSKYTKIRRISRSEGKGARVISIGDEVRDVEAGKIARVDSIAVTWGMNSAERLKAAGASHVVNTVKDLAKTLDELIQTKE